MRGGESDASVIARSVAEPAVFAVIFERHFDEIHRYLRRRLPEHADEIAADVFVAAFDARARYRPYVGESARPWLYGIASHLLSKRRRSQRRSLRAHAREAGHHPAPTGADTDDLLQRLDAERSSAAVAGALAGLAAADRDTLLLYALADLSYEEVAAALGVPVGTVRSRLARARRRCAPLLEEVQTGA